MSLPDLVALYFAAGALCALAIYARAPRPRSRALGSAALAVPLWPLWAPIALSSRAAPADRGGSAMPRTIEAALREGVDAAAGTSLEALLPRDAADRIVVEVRRAAARVQELDTLLSRDVFDLEQAERRLIELEERPAETRSSRALATARLHVDNIVRLRTLRDGNVRALEDLADLVGALRTQLVLARYAGSSADGVGGIVSEVWARVEGLGYAIDAGDVTDEG